MILSGARRPWWYLVFGGGAVLLIAMVMFSHPQQRISNLKDSTLQSMCNDRGYKPPPPATPPTYDYTGPSTAMDTNHYQGKTNYTLHDKPPVKVIGLVFAGRRRYLEILDCYLKRNMVANGGWLDEVKWVIKTDDHQDIAFIQKLVHDTPNWTIQTGYHFRDAYRSLEAGAIYVKIDDDIVFMEDHAIPAIVTRLHNNPQYTLVTANVMNQPAFSFVHYHLGALHPYLPELQKPEGFQTDAPVKNWRLSLNPHWDGNVDTELKEEYEAVYKNHRWLRMKRNTDIVKTPLGLLGHEGKEYTAFNKALYSWAIAAQQHYSFFENLEKNELWRYKFDLWNYWYERLSINFIAFQASTIIENPVPDDPDNDDDEQYLTVTLPSHLNRPAVMDGSAMAVHFGFSPQTELLSNTDLLSRYKNFAQENVCGRPWGSRWTLAT